MRAGVCVERTIRPVHAREDGLERVIFALRDGIKLVIVAARAVDRQTLERAHRGAHHVVAIQILRHAMIHRVLAHRDHQGVIPRPGRQETERHRGLGVLGKKRVARHLLLHEARIRLVIVQRPDHVVPIRPGVPARVVMIVAVSVGVVRDIEPMPRPMLAVPGRSEQPCDEFLVSLLVLVGDKRCHLFGSRRQSGEIIVEPADERAAVGFGRWIEVFLLQLCADERIDWIRIAAGHGGFYQRRERPERFDVLH